MGEMDELMNEEVIANMTNALLSKNTHLYNA